MKSSQMSKLECKCSFTYGLNPSWIEALQDIAEVNFSTIPGFKAFSEERKLDFPKKRIQS